MSELTNRQILKEYTRTKVKVVKYSDKALVVLGETQVIKEKLKEVGGRWNPKLKMGKGWVFSVKKQDTLLQFLDTNEKQTDFVEYRVPENKSNVTQNIKFMPVFPPETKKNTPNFNETLVKELKSISNSLSRLVTILEQIQRVGLCQETDPSLSSSSSDKKPARKLLKREVRQ